MEASRDAVRQTLISTLTLARRLMVTDRDLVFFDLETTGIDVKQDLIIEIALVRLTPSGETHFFEQLINPGVSLPEKVVEITGITDAALASAPPFGEVVGYLNRHFADADVVGYNVVRFDLPLLMCEMERNGSRLAGPADRQVIDAYQLFRRQERHSLERAYAYYTGRPMTQTHRALDDVAATAEVLTNQLARYGLHGTPAQIVSEIQHPYLDSDGKLKEEEGEVVICFGKYRGRHLKEVAAQDPGYLRWMAREMGRDVARHLQPYFNRSGTSGNKTRPAPLLRGLDTA